MTRVCARCPRSGGGAWPREDAGAAAAAAPPSGSSLGEVGSADGETVWESDSSSSSSTRPSLLLSFFFFDDFITPPVVPTITSSAAVGHYYKAYDTGAGTITYPDQVNSVNIASGVLGC